MRVQWLHDTGSCKYNGVTLRMGWTLRAYLGVMEGSLVAQSGRLGTENLI